MKTSTIIKTLTTAFAALLVSTMLSAGVAHALPYTGASTEASPVPAFNVFTPTTGNPLPAPAPSAGENDFLQGRVPVNGDPAADIHTPYSDPVNTTCTNGEIIQLRVYVHNGADAAGNDNGTGPSVAHGTKVQVSISGTTATHPMATISANHVATVQDSVAINCSGQAANLQYVAGSASQFSVATNAATPVNDSIVTSGAAIQSESVPGDVWACWNDRVLVVLSVKVVVPPPAPSKVPPVCTLLTFDNETKAIKIDKVGFTANDAKVTGFSLDFGDSTIKTLGVNDFPFTHTFSGNGPFTVRATVLSDLGNVTSAQCVTTVSFTTPPPTTPTPPATPLSSVTTLPDTGAGSVIGLFAGVTIGGALFHRLFLSRRLAARRSL